MPDDRMVAQTGCPPLLSSEAPATSVLEQPIPSHVSKRGSPGEAGAPVTVTGGMTDPDPLWSERSTSMGSQAASEASMSDMASSHGGSSPRQASGHARTEVGAPPAAPLIHARVKWSDLSDSLVASVALDESLEESLVTSPEGSPKKSSRRSARRRRRREEAKLADACDSGSGTHLAVEDAEATAESNSAAGLAGPHAGPRHVVTLGDIGFDLGLSGRVLCGSAVASGEAPLAPRSVPLSTAAPNNHACPTQRHSSGWEGPCSPCHAQTRPTGLMSTRPCAAGATPPSCEASARVPPLERCPEVAGSPSCPAIGPTGCVRTRPCTNSVTVAPEASARIPIALGMSPARASPARPLPPQLAPCVASPWPAMMPESQWTAPGTPSRIQGVSSIVSTSPLSPASNAVGACNLSAWSPAGTPTADALRSLLRGSGLPSNANLAAQLQAAAPEAYED